ncbi:outer membrane lipoprotein carrier protein LolA [Myxococcota bacterium]|nr:outer membrane lipoprotein carrier protein LolA [Myxococcota bacterium]MCZ7616908.1 outer membrane lipoprotein carrier protein LolA [Myxococcota bacterium]
MRFVAACCLSFVLTTAGFASAVRADDPALDAVLARMASTAGVETAFEERKELSLLSEPLDSHGVLYFVPPDRFARFTLHPGFTSLVVEGRSVHLREGRDGEDTDLSGNPVARLFTEHFVALWSGDRAKLEHLYAAQLQGDLTDWELRLVPRRAPLAGVLDAITLRGDREAVREMIVQERDGDRTVTRFPEANGDRVFSAAEIERIFTQRTPLRGASAGR